MYVRMYLLESMAGGCGFGFGFWDGIGIGGVERWCGGFFFGGGGMSVEYVEYVESN